MTTVTTELYPFTGARRGSDPWRARSVPRVVHASPVAPSAAPRRADGRTPTLTALCGRLLVPVDMYSPDAWPRMAEDALTLGASHDVGVCRRCAEATPGAFEPGGYTYGDGSGTVRARRTRAGRILRWSPVSRAFVPVDPTGTFTPTAVLDGAAS